MKISQNKLQPQNIKKKKKTRPETNKCYNTFRNRLSAYYHYVVIEAEIANLEKLTALSEEAVELISSNYSPYSKV